MPLTGQELHFADQIDGLLDRISKIERYLGGREKISHINEWVKLSARTAIDAGNELLEECNRYKAALEKIGAMEYSPYISAPGIAREALNKSDRDDT